MANPRSFSDAKKAYESIVKQKQKYGMFYKSLFHIHTPASYDYRLMADWTPEYYANISDDEIYRICVEKKVMPDQGIDLINLDDNRNIFASRKEFMSYLLIANSLIQQSISLVVVADHHTLHGIPKLKAAIAELKLYKSMRVYPEVIAGIEISCADRVHVVCVFDYKSATKQKIEEWLDENLLNIRDGSFRTSLDVMEKLSEFGSIPYIAHINTADMFKDERYLSGGYRDLLLKSDYLKIVGLSDISSAQKISGYLESQRGHDFRFVLDNDAHSIDELKRCAFWIKGAKAGYPMVREALMDYDISVRMSDESHSNQFIRGIYIEPKSEDKNNTGFLSADSSGASAFTANFSPSLNCFIGGRGTGKSAVLEILEYVLSQRCKDSSMLNFLCAHGNTWVLYEFEGVEYMVEMAMPYKDSEDQNILSYFGQNAQKKYYYNYHFYKNDVQEYAFNHYLRIFRIEKTKLQTPSFISVPNKREFLKKLFDTRYSINDLVATASSDEINDFIYNILFENEILESADNIIRIRKMSGLKRLIPNIQDHLARRKADVEAVISPFNDSQKDILRIVYTQDIIPDEPPLFEWLFPGMSLKNNFYKKFNIRYENVENYLLNAYDQLSLFPFLDSIANRSITSEQYPILPFANEYSMDSAERSLVEITQENQDQVISNILNDLLNDRNVQAIIDYLKKTVISMEKFKLEFNVNSNVSNQTRADCFKDVRELSLGQKVVAMLDFILGYSDYSKDYRPLIIDQPEDNLDSQYIFNNLVKQLRLAKTKRQVIIATHNATIVTNAMADQVCVMQSNERHGWLEASGYPGENRIKKHIINYLEGGVDSFKHKMHVYNDVLFKTN